MKLYERCRWVLACVYNKLKSEANLCNYKTINRGNERDKIMQEFEQKLSKTKDDLSNEIDSSEQLVKATIQKKSEEAEEKISLLKCVK